MTEIDGNCDLVHQEQHFANIAMNDTTNVPTNYNCTEAVTVIVL